MLQSLERLGDVQVTSFNYPNAYPLEAYPDRLKKVADFRAFLDRLEQAAVDDFS